MHFWSGTTVSREEITDVPAYNRANAVMWGIYALSIVTAGIVSLFSMMAGIILLLVVFVGGLPVLVFAYKRIYKKYRNPIYSSKVKADKKARAQTTKAVIILSVIITVITCMVIGVIFYFGEKELEIDIREDSLQIKGMYGTTIAFGEIADISLIDKSMRDIGVGMRTNGYGGFGGTLKGHFKSETTGDALLFVEADSSPTIKIERIDKKDVYISFSDPEKTEEVYRKLIEKVMRGKVGDNEVINK